MTADALTVRRRQHARDLYAAVKQFRHELHVSGEDWGDVEDELTQAMQHLEVAERMLSEPHSLTSENRGEE